MSLTETEQTSSEPLLAPLRADHHVGSEPMGCKASYQLHNARKQAISDKKEIPGQEE
ncbi:hypothetical protein HJFPF1_02567 [Paramyrothecium foliicola]|nr:hypothetical protein HJFPF1_02567 [Paramyrothecium foliicola]